jgi:hypothetical protein
MIERNYWGTSFNVFDDGLDESSFSKVPDYIGSLRIKLLEI